MALCQGILLGRQDLSNWRLVSFVVLISALSGCGNGDSMESFGGPTMGSTYSIKYLRHAGLPGPKEVQVEVEKILADVDRQMSTYRSDSDIERFNDLPANSCQTMPAAILELVRVGEQLSLQSEGSYDLTVEPLMNLWGFGPQEPSLCSDSCSPTRTNSRIAAGIV